MGKPVEREPKRPYSKPKLTVYGTVRELTQSTGINGQRDAARGGINVKTHI
jgi:hypothetical protein